MRIARHLLVILAAGILVIPIGACHRSHPEEQGEYRSAQADKAAGLQQADLAASFTEIAAGELAAEAPKPSASSPVGTAAIGSRQIMYSADLRIEVKAYDTAVTQVRSIVEAAGGFIADSRVARAGGGRQSGSLDLRVPKTAFSDVLGDLRALGEVKEEAQHGQDVTEEYTDLEARLGNAKRLEARLLDLLERESKSLKDMLAVETELARVREEVERHEGRKRLLDDRLSLATITIELFEPHTYTSSVFDPLWNACAEAGDYLMESLGVLVIVVVVAAPWVLVLGVVAWIVGRILRRWWRRKRGYGS